MVSGFGFETAAADAQDEIIVSISQILLAIWPIMYNISTSSEFVALVCWMGRDSGGDCCGSMKQKPVEA